MFDLIPWRRKQDDVSPVGRQLEFRREFEDLVNRFFGPDPWFSSRLFGQGFSPAVDVKETETEFIVKAEMPGIDQEDLSVSLTGDVLTISGEKKEEKEEKGENLFRIERSFGSFSRSLTVPVEIQEDKIEAKYRDGVLTLRLPKAESTKKKSIDIKVGE
jgi:HSP20 family protein